MICFTLCRTIPFRTPALFPFLNIALVYLLLTFPALDWHWRINKVIPAGINAAYVYHNREPWTLIVMELHFMLQL
jgi:hypothetical protein